MHPVRSSSSGDPDRNGNRLFRKPQRISITVPDHIHRALLARSSDQGRSLSNVAAFLLERAIASEQELVLEEQTCGTSTPRRRSGAEPLAA